MLRIDQNVIIWVQYVKSIKMLKFEWKGKIDQYVKFEWKGGGINQTLKFEDKVGNQSKCWNLSTKHQIVQNVVIWVKSGESIKKLTFECNKVGIDQNVEIWVPNVKSIKMLKFERKRGDRSNVDILLQKWKSIKLLEFDWKIRNWSEYWNLRTTLRIDQNVEIWVKMSSRSKCWNLSEKKGSLIKMSKFEWRGESIKTLKFEDKVGNQSKCWNLSANGQIDQNVEIWVKQQ